MMEPKRAALVYNLTFEMASFVLSAYRAAIPEIPYWWNEVEQVLKTQHAIRNPFGRQRIFFDRVTKDTLRDALSDSAQSIVSGLVNRGATIFETSTPENEGYLLLQVHDELVVESPEEHAMSNARRLKWSMEYPLTFPHVKTPLVVPAEVGIAKNWYEAGLDEKKVKL